MFRKWKTAKYAIKYKIKFLLLKSMIQELNHVLGKHSQITRKKKCTLHRYPGPNYNTVYRSRAQPLTNTRIYSTTLFFLLDNFFYRFFTSFFFLFSAVSRTRRMRISRASVQRSAVVPSLSAVR